MNARFLRGRSMVQMCTLLMLLGGMLAIALCAGCSSSDQSVSTGSSTQFTQDTSADQSTPTGSSDLSATTNQQDATSGESTGYATGDEADGYQTLGGYWKVAAITYKDKIVYLKDSEELADLYSICAQRLSPTMDWSSNWSSKASHTRMRSMVRMPVVRTGMSRQRSRPSNTFRRRPSPKRVSSIN